MANLKRWFVPEENEKQNIRKVLHKTYFDHNLIIF